MDLFKAQYPNADTSEALDTLSRSVNDTHVGDVIVFWMIDVYGWMLQTV